MKRFCCALICLTSMAARALAAQSAGTTAVPFLQLGAGAEGLGMGGAYTTLADGANALFWNPAGLATHRSADVALNHQSLLQTLNYDSASVAFPAGSLQLGVNYAQLRSSSIDALDASGNSVGTFTTKDQTAAIGAGKTWQEWQAGVSGKWIRSSLANTSATAWALDTGVISPSYAQRKFQHALVLQNVGNGIRYDQVSEPLPMQLKFGTLFRPLPALRFTLDLIEAKDGSNASVGTEYEIPLIKDRSAIFLRAGYATVRNDVGAGVSLGGGIAIDRLQVDFAWIPESDFGSSEVFSLRYRFSNPSTEEAVAPPAVQATPKPSHISANEAAPPPAVTPEASPRAPYQIEPYERKSGSAKSRVYVVRPGDTLISIAKAFYGDGRLWRLIYSANRHLIGDSSTIEVGQSIIIPNGN